MRTLFHSIQSLYQTDRKDVSILKGDEMKHLPKIDQAYLLIENDKILDYGSMDSLKKSKWNPDLEVNLSGKSVFPGYIDSHTHLVYAKNRSQEFVDRINGLSYAEIANRGGGILNSARALKNTPIEVLFADAKNRLQELINLGTTAIEIKSGYGLDLESEIKMLRVVEMLKKEFDMTIKATFLGAHAFPEEYKNKPNDYVNLIVKEMIPEIAKQNLADYIDVFCEKGYFSTEQTNQILVAGKQYGLKAKIHVNQFHSIGGIEIATKHKAISVDHLEELNDNDLNLLKESNTIPVALPSCSFFLSIPYTPARKIIDSGLALALASDFNPGSTPSGNLNFVFSTACIKMHMTPEEAFNALTLNAAAAIEVSKEEGSIDIGKKANFIISKPIESIYDIPYNFGNSKIDQVYINGKLRSV